MDPQWNKIYLALYTYADQLLKCLSWFRGKGSDSYLKGKQAHDYAQEAIEKYLTNPEKYDPALMSLTTYLKKHLIRQSIWNDWKRLEHRVSSTLKPHPTDDDDGFNDNHFLRQEVIFDQEMDLDQIMDHVASQIQHDQILVKIFQGHCRDMLPRREVIEHQQLSENEYDNGIRRLTTILKATGKKFGLKAPKKAKRGGSY